MLCVFGMRKKYYADASSSQACLTKASAQTPKKRCPESSLPVQKLTIRSLPPDFPLASRPRA